jgi:hypothetical protein
MIASPTLLSHLLLLVVKGQKNFFFFLFFKKCCASPGSFLGQVQVARTNHPHGQLGPGQLPSAYVSVVVTEWWHLPILCRLDGQEAGPPSATRDNLVEEALFGMKEGH